MIETAELNAWLGSVAGDAWLMEPRRLQAFLASPLQETSARVANTAGGDLPFEIKDGVAHIPIAGVMLRSVPWWMSGATSTPKVRAYIGAALSEPSVKSILLRVSSPGGSVAGVGDLADAVYAATKIKPIHAHAEDMAGSAAYWVGSQASRFTAEPTAEIGSIGAYRAIVDNTRMLDGIGIKVHLVRSGPQKGTGHPGVPVSDAEIAHQQSLIDGLADLFVGAVARGRRKPREEIEPSATGATWLAADAVKRGLIDAVEHADAAHSFTVAGTSGAPSPARLANAPASKPASGAHMSDKTPHEEIAAAAPAPTEANVTVDAIDTGAAVRIAELEQALALEQAKVAAFESSITEIQKARKTEALEVAIASGRIAPSSVELWTTVASATPNTDAGVSEFRARIAKVPQFTRPNAQGVDLPEAKTGGAADKFSAAELEDLKRRGKDAEKFARTAEIAELRGTNAKLKSGEIVNLNDYLAGKAG